MLRLGPRLRQALVPLPGGYTRPGAFLQGVSASVAPASCGLPLRGLASSRVHAAELPLAAGASPEPYGNSDVAPISLASAASAWLASLPKGFGRARGTDSKQAPEAKAAEGDDKGADKGAAPKEGDKSSKEASSSKDSAKSSKGSSSSKKGKGGWGGFGEGGGGGGQYDTVGIVLGSAATLYALYVLVGQLRPDGAEISWQEFRNTFLSTGMVDKLEIVNKEYVRVHLRATPNYAVLEAAALAEGGPGASRSPLGVMSSAQGISSATDAGLDPGSLLSSLSLPADREAELRKALEAAKAHRTPYFRIGSVESFERQLEDAQIELRLRPRDFVLVRHTSETNPLDRLFALAPTLLLIGLFMALSRGIGSMGAGIGGGGGREGINRIFNVGKAKPAVMNKDSKVKIMFKDVAGCDEAKAEVMEFVQFLRDPSKFTNLGAKIPKGALLVGPPGTGKTLLAKAVAGESGTPFFSMSGSDFIEMFVGVGASRVRDLFAQARQSAPCIVFIDEIDAVARARSKGGFGGGGNEERENTLNQLLVEMDGFTTTEGVVVLAGTNRVDILDKAILRPGRFDRQITVDKPDIKGRKEIFLVHLKPIKIAGDPEAYAQRLAALTPGFVGADIHNICNEAAIVAARAAKDKVDLKDFETAIDRVIGGAEKRNSLMTPEEKKTVAYHEAGHAIAGWFLQHADPLLKVTIIPRSSGALGFAQYLPKEMALHTREALLDRMCMALGGRVAEEIFFGQVTTGAQDDLDRVTQMAYAMTTIYGMSAKLGNLSFPPRQETQFEKPYSDATAQLIDEEVRNTIGAAYARTKELLTSHQAHLKAVAELLLQRETINQNDIEAIAGPRPFKVHDKLKEYVSMMFEEPGKGGKGAAAKGEDDDDDDDDEQEKSKEEKKEGEAAGEAKASSA